MAKLPEMTSYYNENLHMTITVPVGWTGKILNPHAFRIFGPPEANFDDYRSTMSYELGNTSLVGKEGLADIARQSLDDLETDMNEFKVIREEHLLVSGRAPAFARWYEWRDEETNLHFSQIQAFIMAPQARLYLINAATLKPLEDRYIPIFNAILKSTQIITLPV